MPSTHSTDYTTFAALTIKRSGSFKLDMEPGRALSLFTAPGEELWVPDWQPFILHGDGYKAGTIWITQNGTQQTYWYVALFEYETGRARYVRVSPQQHSGTVEVEVAPNCSGGSIVGITYQLTGLTRAGNAEVAKMLRKDRYARMMEDWQTMIVRNRVRIEAYYDSLFTRAEDG